jgi:hypothetical protein
MDLLAGYGDGDSSGGEEMPPVKTHSVPMKKFAMAVSSAPAVADDLKALQVYHNPKTKVLKYNPKAEEMWRPLAVNSPSTPLTRLNNHLVLSPQSTSNQPNATSSQGPFNPYSDTSLGREQGVVQNAVTGFVEPTEFNGERTTQLTVLEPATPVT